MTGLLTAPLVVRGRALPPPLLVLLAAVGATLLAVVASSAWSGRGDDHAYWLAARRLVAGEPLYDPSAAPGTPFAFWYPPVVAQLLAPVALALPAGAFSAVWTAGLLGCLWWLAGRRILPALALVAFLPVAVELGYRNIHLFMAVLIVLAIRRSALWWVAAIALQVTPAIALLHLVTARRWRAVGAIVAVGALALVASVALSPGAWRDYAAVVLARAGGEVASFLPIAFPVRLGAGAVLAALSGRAAGRRGDLLLVLAVVLAQPTFWTTALATAVAAPALQLGRAKKANPADSPTDR